MNPDHTIRTSRSGRRAAALLASHERAQAPTVQLTAAEGDALTDAAMADELADALRAMLAVTPVPVRDDGEVAGARRLAVAALDKLHRLRAP